MSKRRPSNTPRTTISISDDLSADFDALRAFVEAGELSLSRYLITAAVLCMNAGIDDPAAASIGDLFMGDLVNGESEFDQDDQTTTTSSAADRALDKLFL